MTIPARIALRTTALSFATALVLAACSSGGGGNRGGTASTAAGRTGTGTKVTVTETEYALKLSRSSFTPGTYTFTADNAGKISHGLTIDGPGVSDATTKIVQGGHNTAVTVKLKKGTYDLYCPVSGHKALGMEQHIKVG